MFQSNKEYINFLLQSGVHTFLKETPNKLLESEKLSENKVEKKVNKKIEDVNEIKELIPLISDHKSSLKNTAKKIGSVVQGKTETSCDFIGINNGDSASKVPIKIEHLLLFVRIWTDLIK